MFYLFIDDGHGVPMPMGANCAKRGLLFVAVTEWGKLTMHASDWVAEPGTLGWHEWQKVCKPGSRWLKVYTP